MIETIATLIAPAVVGIHLVSAHTERGFNNVNPGIYAKWDSFAGGVYHNSQRKTTVWAGYSIDHRVSKNISLGIVVGGATGYSAAKVVPLVLPSISLHNGDFAVRASIVPKMPNKSPGAVHFSVEWRLR